ncbi:hypothetical protein [Nocardioides sp.]|uniref:hypothetical protein n=1 Tax=Nocardioides sp. TaxID=35761 RepID=UPI00271FD4C9|nr:hypothetical protein [Nocardioides sp.]MDO9455222.1 hypothetical protein [Nocardioides sp.]
MVPASFYSDRTGGTVPRTATEVPDSTWRGLHSLVNVKLDADWFAEAFPEPCPDGRGTIGTNRTNFFDTVQALVPSLPWPAPKEAPATATIFDLIEFAAQRVSKPSKARYHPFFSHDELKFDRAAGRSRYRDEVNELLSRGGVAFELRADLTIARLGPPEGRQVVADLMPDTGDARLDELIVEARTRFLSRHPDDLRAGLERLWDAFERLKTLEPGSNKALQAKALLDRAASGYMRDALDAESRNLTEIGNRMQIRHFETNKDHVEDLEVDYLFVRMAGFLVHVLRATGRLAT